MPRGDRLFTLLQGCDDRQLRDVWTADLRMKPKKREFDRASALERHLLISAELRSAAGHTLANVRRGPHDLPWGDILDLVVVGLAADTEGGGELLNEVVGARGGDDDLRERAALMLAEARVRGCLVSSGLDPDDLPHDPDSADARIAAEDDALRTVNPSEYAIARLTLEGAGRAAAGFRAVAEALSGEVRFGLRAMRPSYRKVVPATVRLLQINGVAPLPPDHA